MKTILLILGFILMMSFAFAETNPICDYLIDDIGAEVGGALPRGMPFGNEAINFYSNSSAVGHVITEKKIITSIGCDEINDSTYKITIKDLETIKTIRNADSIADAFDDAISDGEIKVEGQKFTKKVKSFFARAGIKIASWFS